MIAFEHSEKILFQGKPKKSILFIWIFSRVLLWTFIISIVGSFLIMPGLVIIAAISYKTNSFAQLGSSILVVIASLFWWLFLFGSIFLYQVYLLKSYEYYITNRRVIFKGGLIRKSLTSVPFNKITNTEISQNLIEQFLGIYSFHIQTAGLGGVKVPEIIFVGLENASVPEKVLNDCLQKHHKDYSD